jgi:plasmid maintenance system antidote protein VapI
MNQYSSLYLKKDIWEHIIAIKGWDKRGALTKCAAALNISKQMLEQILQRKRGISAEMIGRFRELLNLKDGDHWDHLFETGAEFNENNEHPSKNFEKFYGNLPYSPNSNTLRPDAQKMD